MTDAAKGETCQACGRTYHLVYRVPDHVWLKITPAPDTLGPYPEHQGGGLLCPDCAHARSADAGMSLYFEASVGDWKDNVVLPTYADGREAGLREAAEAVGRYSEPIACCTYCGDHEGSSSPCRSGGRHLFTSETMHKPYEEAAIIILALTAPVACRFSPDLMAGGTDCRLCGRTAEEHAPAPQEGA